MVNPLDSQYIEASNPERHYLKRFGQLPIEKSLPRQWHESRPLA